LVKFKIIKLAICRAKANWLKSKKLISSDFLLDSFEKIRKTEFTGCF